MQSEHDALEVKYKGLFKQYEELLHSRVTETKQRAPASLPVAPALPQERAQGVLQLQLHEKENQINRLLTTVKNLEKQLADAHDHHNHTKRQVQNSSSIAVMPAVSRRLFLEAMLYKCFSFSFFLLV